jgi:hypothetical protein
MSLRELASDLSVIETKIRGLRIVINLPITQNRDLTVSEREKVKTALAEILTIINKHLSELQQ